MGIIPYGEYNEAMKKPVLYIPMGLPGAGKSTYFKQMKDVVAVSGDGVREELFGDEALQFSDAYLTEHGYDVSAMDEKQKFRICTKAVWDRVNARVASLLREGRSAAYDGLNHRPRSRGEGIRLAKGIAVVHGILFAVDAETCIQRDLARNRTVGEDVIRMFERQFVQPDMEEGFDILDVVDEDGMIIAHCVRDGFEAE